MRSKITFLSIVTLLLLTNCKKDETTFTAYFYTITDTSEANLHLLINGDYKGKLPYLPNEPNCENGDLTQALTLVIGSKKYNLIAKDEDGNIVSSGNVQFTNNSIFVEHESGMFVATKLDDCIFTILSKN